MSTATMQVIRASGPRPFAPAQSEFTVQFWMALGEGRFLVTQCGTCAKLSFPPKPFCPHCWSQDVRWQPITPEGVVYSATTIYAAPQAFLHEAPYHVGIVDLTVGLRLATRLLGADSSAHAIGQPVQLVVVQYTDGPLFAARVSESS